MLFLNKTILLPTICALKRLLIDQYITPLKTCFYGDRIAIKHFMNRDMNVVRMWKAKSFMDWCYDDFSSSTFIGAIDYTIFDDNIKIEYMNINDSDNILYNKLKFKMDDEEAMKVNSAMIKFIKNIANENNKPKVIIDVHNNLKIFNKYYKYEGFKVTNRKAVDNPFWLEAELLL